MYMQTSRLLVNTNSLEHKRSPPNLPNAIEISSQRTTHPLEMTPCQVEALEKCLRENKGDSEKCREEIEAFEQSCSRSK